MKTKIVAIFLPAVAFMTGVVFFGSSVFADPGVQFQCPDGLIYNLTTKKCSKIVDTKAPVKNNTSVTCPSGYESFYDQVTQKNSCIKTEDTSTAPCPSGEQGRGSSKPGCWKQSGNQSCLYGNADTVSDDQCWSAGTQTAQTLSAGEQNYMDQCKASGKSDADCKAALDANKTGCQQQVNNNTYKNMDDCLNHRATYDYGQCSDGSKPSISTGKCADGSDPKKPGDNSNGGANPSSVGASGKGGKCGDAQTTVIDCNGKTGAAAIAEILRQIIAILSVGVGIVAVGGIVFGAILYSSARDNAAQTQQAIGIIRNVVIGIIMYVFMVSIVNWLVPGGVIGT